MHQISFNSLRRRLEKYPHLNELEDFINKILASTQPVLIILFGSLAKGNYTQFSDIDVLCVYDKFFTNNKERFLYSYKYSRGIVQTKTLSLNEFKQGLIEGNKFLQQIVSEGIILFSEIHPEKMRQWVLESKNIKNN